MAGQQPPGGSEDDFLEHFFAFPSAGAGGHASAGGGAPGDHPFPLALSLDAAAEASGGAKPVSFLPNWAPTRVGVCLGGFTPHRGCCCSFAGPGPRPAHRPLPTGVRRRRRHAADEPAPRAATPGSSRSRPIFCLAAESGFLFSFFPFLLDTFEAGADSFVSLNISDVPRAAEAG